MQYKRLGKSNLNVSVIGFGGIPVQRITNQECKELIARSEYKGINFVDTARGYTISENYLGEALKGRRGNWIIASKSMARDKEGMARDIEVSLKNLQTDYIDLYQVHNLGSKADYDKVFRDNGAYQALLSAKAEGKIGHIGVTSHSVDILKALIEDKHFESIMYPYNIVETQADALFERAAELNIGVIAMKPMAGGALQDGALALKFILQNKNITTAIPGIASLGEVDQNAAVGDNISGLSAEERVRITKIAEELGSEFCRRCGYCAPCSQGIDIPALFIAEAYKKRYNLDEWAEGKYMRCEKRAKDCISCGICETRCPYNLPIRKMMESVRKTFSNID